MRILKSIVLIPFQLQDFALIPNASDSRLNTAECVSGIGSDSDSVNELIYAGNMKYGISALQTLFSLIGSFIFGTLLMLKIENIKKNCKKNCKSEKCKENCKDRESAFRFTALVIVFLYFVLLVVIVVFGFLSCKGTICNGHIIFLLCDAFLQLALVVVGFCSYRKNDCSIYYPLCLGICYHFLWVVLGVFADPLWGFSVLLSIFSLFLLVYILAYYCKLNDSECYALFVCFLAMVMFVSFVAFCWMSVRFLLTNQPIAGLIQTALATVVSLILSVVSLFPAVLPSKKKK